MGKTENSLKTRFTGHRFDVNHDTDKQIGRHFNSTNHSLNDIIIVAFDQLPNADTFKMRNKETFWMKILGTIEPKGLNLHDQANFPIGR